MADLGITEAVNRTEEAIETGNYERAIENCRRLLGELPEFATAYRLMGEAHLENGDFEDARVAFQRTLERDPQSIAAHLGLGKIAEEQGDQQAALAHYQVAWEIDPRRRDLREHVSRISQLVYGEDGRLYLTRAALASLHFHAGRWDRSVSEAAQVLQEQHGRIDVQIRMAEALWRRGDVEQAAQVSGTVLRAMPSAVVPLLIQADIFRAQGNEEEAGTLLSQARAIDPAGVRAADLVMVGQEDQSEFLIVDEEPKIEESVLDEAPAGRYAPAPDFMSETMALGSTQDQVSGESSEHAAPSGDDVVAGEETRPPVQPFQWDELGDQDLEVSDLSDDREQAAAAGSTPDNDSPSFELFSDEELERARPGDERPPGFTGMLNELDEQGMQPFEAEATSEHETWMTPEPDTQDQTSELAPEGEEPEPVPQAESELVQDSVDELSAQDPFDLDWSEVDREIEEAIPGETPRGYTGELQALDESGMEPFSFDEGAQERDAFEEELEDTGVVSEHDEETSGAWDFVESESSDEPGRDIEPPAFSWDDIDLESDREVDAGTMPLAEEPSGPDDTVESLFGSYEPQLYERTEHEVDDDVDSMFAEEPDQVSDVVSEWELNTGDQEELAVDEVVREVESDAGDELAWEMPQASSPEEVVHGQASGETAGLSGVESIQRLGLEHDLIERARRAKAEVVGQGRIEGTDRLPALGPDINELRSRVEADPGNADHRVELANALAEDDPSAALSEFRWVYVNAWDRAGDVVERLVDVASVPGDHEVEAHRLVGAYFRRSNDWQAAAGHYQESILARRRA